MRNRVVVLLAMAVMAVAMMVAMAMPAFAAEPTTASVICEDESGGVAFVETNTERVPGRAFGQANAAAAELGFHGQECERGLL